MATRSSEPKINRWCVDGAATSNATWDRRICFNIRNCNVSIHGANSKDEGNMTCSEIGDAVIWARNDQAGGSTKVLVRNVLINSAFPFHIFSEIVAFDCGNSANKKKNSWTFSDDGGRQILHASQQLLDSRAYKGRSDTKLYYIDEAEGIGRASGARGKAQNHFAQDSIKQMSTATICRVCESPKEAGNGKQCMICSLLEASTQVVDRVNATVATPRAAAARPYYNCGRCTYRQPRVGPDVCIMCLKHTTIGYQQIGKKKAHQGARKASTTMAAAAARALWNTAAPKAAKRGLDFEKGQTFLQQNGRRLMESSSATKGGSHYNGMQAQQELNRSTGGQRGH